MKKRILSILLAVLAVFTLLITPAAAVDLPSYSRNKPIITYTAKSSGKEEAYSDSSLKKKNGGYISCSTDECHIIEIKGTALKVSYPISGGKRRDGWFPYTAFTGRNLGADKVKLTFKATKKITTYKWKNNTKNTFGHISKGDKCYLLRGDQNSDWLQLIYPVSGGHKMAWVKGDDLYANKITVSPTSVKLTSKGATKKITTTLSSDSADKVTWKSNNTSVATVNSSGVITAVGNGKTTITATTLRDKTAKVSVEVVINTPPSTVNPTGISITTGNFTLNVGSSKTLSATITPSNATNKTITWKSGNTSIATVSSSGSVKAVGVGSTTITATTSNGKSSSVTVTTKNNTNFPTITKDKYISTYTYNSSGRIDAYNGSDLKTKTGGYIDCATDECRIQEISGNAVKVSYPTSKERKVAWFSRDAFTARDLANPGTCSTFTAKKQYTTYRWKGKYTTFGSISKGDNCYYIRGDSTSEWLQVLYPTGSTYKMGWALGRV